MLNDGRPRISIGAPGGGPPPAGGRRMSLQGVLLTSQRRRASEFSMEGGLPNPSALMPHSREPSITASGAASRLSFSGESLAPGRRKAGRYEAMTALKGVQAADGRSEALAGRRRSSYEPSYGWGSESLQSQSRSMYMPHQTIPESANSSAGQSRPPSHAEPKQKRPGALWGADEAEDIADFRAQQHAHISADSSIDDIRKYGQAVQHPGKLMSVLPDEYNREVHTEFDTTCNELLSVLGEFETALEEMTIWKDDFLKQTVPSNIKLQLTLLFARLFRSKSDLHEPMFELIKQVRVYSRPWVDKSFALVELEKDYMRQCHMIDVAIRKMEQMQLQVATIRSEKRVALWEKLTRRVMEVFPDHYGQYIDEQSIIPAIPAKEKHKERDKEKEKDENAAPGPGPVSDGTLSDLPVSRPSSSLSDGTSDEDDEDDDEDEDRNDMPHGTIKDSIRDYIAEDRPSWKRIARDLVVTFRGLLEDCHPDFQEVLGALHRRPFPRSPAPIYLSAHTGSILQRERRIPRMRKAWSTPDLRALARSEALMADPNLLVKAGLRRSNSFATFQTFRRRGRSYTIPHPFQFGLVPRRDNAPPTTALPVEPEQEQEDPLPETESEDSDPEDVVDMGGSLEDIEYMGDYDDEELEEVVNRFMEERPMVFPEEEHEGGGEGVEGGESGVEGEISAEIGEPMAVGRKATFSLQEIMELTMLHAQQMQLLQFEYEGRIQKMKIAMADQEAEHEEKVEAFEARVDMLHQRSKRIAHEYQKQAKEVMFADEKQRSARRSRTSTSRIGTAGGGSSRGGNGGGDANNDIPEDSIDMLVASGDMLSSKERESELGASREGRGSIRGDQGGTPGSLGASESRASSKQSSRKHSRQRGTMHSRQLQAQREAKAKKLRRAEKIARQRRSARSRFTPVFQSAPFAMSFMDRLRWFTEMKLQKRSRITEKFRRLEIDANEERLKQYQLLAPNATTATKDHSGEPNKLPAEFMPMPGDVPPAKRRAGELWGQQGITLPWGGRYNVHRGRRGQAINILNLFDVAMSIELPRRKGQHYGRDD